MSIGKGELPFKVTDLIGLFNFVWHSQNKVGNIAILVLWTDREKLLVTIQPISDDLKNSSDDIKIVSLSPSSNGP